MDNAVKDSLANKSQKKSIKPGFLGGSGGGDAPSGLNRENPGLGREDAASLAEKNLNDAEKAASGGLYNRGDDLDGAREAENSKLYNNGAGKMAAKAANIATRGKFKGVLKKGGPAVGIIFVIFLVGALMGGTQFFQPFSLIAQFQETFNSMEKSANARSTRWMRWQLGDYVKDPVKGSKIFGNEHFKISDKQAEELKKQGIELNEDRTEMTYKNAKGEEKTVTAGDFKETFDTDTEFFHKYSAGSMTWRGQFANWFGTNTTNFLKNNKITRNLWHDFKEGQDKESGMKTVKKKLSDRMKTIQDGGMRVMGHETEDATDEEGNKIQEIGEDGKPVTDAEGNPVYAQREELRIDSESPGTITRGDTDQIKTKLDDISAKFNGAASIGCGIMGAIGAVNLLVAADEALQIINITSSYFEAVNKTQAGYGDESPINELAETLNAKQESSYTIVNEGGDGYEETPSVFKTAMQAAGVGALYSGGVVDPNDPSVQSFNIAASAKRLLGGVGLSMAEFEGCLVAKSVTALASAVIDVVTIGSCILGALGAAFTFGLSLVGCSGLAAQIAAQIAFGAGMGWAIGAVMSVLTPVAMSILTRDLVSNIGGEELGNALTYGANTYQGGAHRGNGGSLSTATKYTEYAVVQRQVIAENARYERESLSPFDVTSKYTFMGSIMTQLMSFNTTSSLMGTVTAGGSVMSSSLLGLASPVATAYDIADYLPGDDYEETCPYLASIGAVGDSFCNPYIMTDVSTMDDDPGTVINKLFDPNGDGDMSDSVLEDNETSDGNVIIKKDSDLAKYIRYCSNKSSGWGMADQGIVNEVSNAGDVSTGVGSLDGLVNGAIGSIPVVGDVIEIAQDQQAMDNIGYISGQSCVAGNDEDGDFAGTPDATPKWSKAKYYQRFIEDQSLAESVGLIDKSAVAAYLDEYYEENPLDDSYEGMLARYSGLDKETIEETLDVIAYYNYIANYDATERYAFEGVSDGEETERAILLDEENVLDGDVVMPENIVYADVRNRNFAA